MRRITAGLLCLSALWLVASLFSSANSIDPQSPQEEHATFRIVPGFRIELAAAEPNVVDPVAMAFDEHGRLYVAEMRGYPNGGVGTGEITSGKIKRLEDRDGDGTFEHAVTFAEGLRFPMGVMPWKGGLLVAMAPDILYLEDTDNNGKADRKTTLYTDFNLKNIQQMINGLQWGLDNWVYGVAGSDGGVIRSVEKPEMPPVALRGRGVRFHPERPGSLEPTSGGGQYGLTPDEWQRWFTATNSQHLRHIVLPDHYLGRNPALAVGATTLDIPEHGAACKVFRISPFEAWRVERTTRRALSPDAKRFAATELVPGGFVTSGCSPLYYAADLFPPEYRGSIFVCDPANNLVLRDVLEPKGGATFVARRGHADCEFLASTDNWFRPVQVSLGPDGAVYVLDFYREAIETPLSLPDDIKQRLNLESRGRGRIWRIVPTSNAVPARKVTPPARLEREALVRELANPNIWWRLTAQRLLVERQDKLAIEPLRKLARESASATGRAHALWTMYGLGGLTEAEVLAALKDSEPGVRAQGLRLADDGLAASAALRTAVTALASDPSPQVRFQMAFTLGETDTPEGVAALAAVARQDGADPWVQTAILSSAAKTAPGLLEALVRDAAAIRVPFLTRLAALVGARANDADLARVLGLLATGGSEDRAWQLAVLEGVGQGLQNTGRSLARLWEQPSPALTQAAQRALPFFTQAGATARDSTRPAPERLAALRLLAHAPFRVAGPALHELLGPQHSGDVQLAAVRALAQHDGPRVAEMLLTGWTSYSPAARREVLEALFARADRLAQLLDAVERKQVLPGQLEPSRIDQLRKHPSAALRQRAQTLLAGQASPDRKKIVDDYRSALDLKADAVRGKAVFKKNCATCHRLDNEGIEVGPDLVAVLRNKNREQLVSDVLDPSREVDPRYLNYLVTTRAGRTFTGMVAVETASSLTLRRAEKAEDTILRSEVEEISATAKSVMPEGLEIQLSKQDLADLIAHLQSAAMPR